MENSELVTQSRNLGLHGRAGLKRRADQGNKCDENRTHLESDDNLSNGRNVFLINQYEVFGMHRNETGTESGADHVTQCRSSAGGAGYGTEASIIDKLKQV
jgi:hypothetical protein